MDPQILLTLADRCATILPKIAIKREHAERIVDTVRSYIDNPLLDDGAALDDVAEPYLRAPPMGDDGPPWRAVQFLIAAAIDATNGATKGAEYNAARCEHYLTQLGA
jgi:hypothetical protein